MDYLIALPIIFVSIAIVCVAKYMKFKLLGRIFKLIFFLAVAFLVYRYLTYNNFSIKNIF